MFNNLEEANKKIKELENTIETQKIVIESLITQIKTMGFVKHTLDTKTQFLEDTPKKFKENTAEKEKAEVEVEKEKELPKEVKNRHLMESEIEEIFKAKRESRPFRDNIFLSEFVRYAVDSHCYTLNNKSMIKIKNPAKQYIINNIEKILSFLIENINNYNLNALCSTLNIISSDVVYKRKIVAVHDMILFVNNFSKLPFLISALFNNQEIHEDTLGRTIKKILAHQYAVDTDIYQGNGNILNYYKKICLNLGVKSLDTPLSDLHTELIENVEVFDEGEINPIAIQNMYSLRIYSHYMDWDFTYNRLILEILYPKIQNDKSPSCALYAMSLTFNALRLFGPVESVSAVLEELSSFMIDSSDVSAVIYLFIKQIKPLEAEKWLNTNRDTLNRILPSYLKELMVF